MSRLTLADFKHQFLSVVPLKDELIVVYSGIWTFGHRLGLPPHTIPRAILEAMIECLSPEQTLLLPAYTYDYTRTREFSPRDSVPETGVLPVEMLRSIPCVRTQSALNSFLAVGKRAQGLRMTIGPTLWGDGSLKSVFERDHARMVVLGRPWKDACGFLHRIEEACDVPYRYHKTFNGRWIEDGAETPWSETMFVRSISCVPVFRWSKVDKSLDARGKILHGDGDIQIESADAFDIVETGRDILKDDPFALLENSEQVRRWVKWDKANEIKGLRAVEPQALAYYDSLKK